MSKVWIFPTDTVYGLGTPYLDKAGIERIYDIKGRSFDKPIAILVANLNQAQAIGIFHENALKVAKHFWPGGLTIVCKSSTNYYALTGEKTIGLRMPNHQTALALTNEFGPLKTTSVNYSDETPLNDYQMIVDKFGSLVDKVYKNHEPLTQVSSTVIDFTHDLPLLIRQGDIQMDQIMKVLEK